MKSIITIVLMLSVSFVTVSQANELTRLYERAFNFLGIEFGQNSNEVALLTEWQEGLEEVMVAVGESRRDHVAGQAKL